MEDMYLRTFMMPEEDEVKAMVDDLVGTIANTVTKAAMLVAVNSKVDGNWLWRMVMDECERVTGHRDNKAYVVIHYGIDGALVGDVDFEDAPIRRFEDDVFDAVETELTNREVEITC